MSKKLLAGWLVLVPALLGAAEPSGPEDSIDSRPNLVLILSDDHRWDALGAAGNPAIHTPVLDTMAQEGLYFPQATIHVSQCPPSRATLLTGLPPHLHGVHALQYREPRAETAAWLCGKGTLPALLQEAGYVTGLAGKWHLGPEPWECGFDEVSTWLPTGGAKYQDP